MSKGVKTRPQMVPKGKLLDYAIWNVEFFHLDDNSDLKKYEKKKITNYINNFLAVNANS